MSTDYVVWLHKIESDACDLLEFSGFKRSYRLKSGMPLIDEWPDDVVFDMNEDHPDQTRLVDSLFNIKSLLVVSERLCNHLKDQELEDVEFLPVGVRDHTGRLIDEPYFVINITRSLDCLDQEASGAEESFLTDEIDQVNGIVLKNESLLEGRRLVRLSGFGDPTLIERSLADSLSANGFTGFRWGELRDFTDKTW